MIGPSFKEELEAAGVDKAVIGWRGDTLIFADSATEQEKQEAERVKSAHDPNKKGRGEIRKETSDLEQKAIRPLINFCVGTPQEKAAAEAELRTIKQQLDGLTTGRIKDGA